MAPQSSMFADTLKSFWHAVTTNDRHAAFDSTRRNGQRMSASQPLYNSPHAVSSIAGDDSSRFSDPLASSSSFVGVKSPSVAERAVSPPASYSPGMRSAQRSSFTTNRERGSSIDKTPAEIQLQSFNDGLPPAPPVEHSWKRIERWLEDNFGELHDNLCGPATINDINELQHELKCVLPDEIRDSLQIHDGQERGGRPTGIIFGCMLLDCEEIVEEWSNWRAVNEQYLLKSHKSAASTAAGDASIPIAAIAGPSSPSMGPASSPNPSSLKSNSGVWREDLLDKQDSQPPNAVQKAYAHTGWIPLARDWGGNCLAVDLDPGPMGTHGQIIIFGRDYDCKFVVTRSWASFLASLADDLTAGSEKVHIDEESSELKFRPFKRQGVEPPYLEILRWRCDQKYGRRPPLPRRRTSGSNSPAGLRINSNVPGSSTDRAVSPYSSPGGLNISDRGRSPHRSVSGSSAANGKAPMVTNSPMRPHVSSPLARVTEENSLAQHQQQQDQSPLPALKLKTDSEALKSNTSGAAHADKLISVDTPTAGGDYFPITRLGPSSPNKENQDPATPKARSIKSPTAVTSNGDGTAAAAATPSKPAQATDATKEASADSAPANKLDEDTNGLVDEFKTVAI